MIKKELQVMNPEGLHGRPVNYLNTCSGCFKSSIWIEHHERRVNAKSLMGVLSLGVMQCERIVLIADGPDENLAVEQIGKLIKSGFMDEDLIDEIMGR